MDPDGIVTLCNRAAEDLYGVTREQAVGVALADVLRRVGLEEIDPLPGMRELQRTGRIALPKLARRPAKLRAVKNRAV